MQLFYNYCNKKIDSINCIFIHFILNYLNTYIY